MGGFKADSGDQLPDGALSVSQKLEYLDSRRVGERPKQICLYLVDGTGNRCTSRNLYRVGTIGQIIRYRAAAPPNDISESLLDELISSFLSCIILSDPHRSRLPTGK